MQSDRCQDPVPSKRKQNRFTISTAEIIYICAMRNVLVCLLVSCFLSSSLITEAVKMPTLFSHYIDHVHRNPDIDFLDFLSMHYWGNDIKDSDWNQDMKLPFKKFSASQHQLLFCRSNDLNLLDIKNCLAVKRLTFSQENSIDAFSSELYRPPRGPIYIYS